MARLLAKKTSSKYRSDRSHQNGELRIIGGKWRSRKLVFPIVDGLRPSPSRIRETLFSWLISDLPNSQCLDLFAGSGALGFEALSRGARSVTMVELNKLVLRQLKTNRELLQAEALQILNQDATNLSTIKDKFDIVFCDPPFNQGFAPRLIDNLQQSTLLVSHAKVYIETEKSLVDLPLPEDWQLLKEKVTGDVRYRLIKVGEY